MSSATLLRGSASTRTGSVSRPVASASSSAGEGGREQHGLTLDRHGIQQPLDVGPEAHLQQPIRLVQYQMAQLAPVPAVAGPADPAAAPESPPAVAAPAPVRPVAALAPPRRTGSPAADPTRRPALQRLAHLHRQLAGRYQHQPLYPVAGRIEPLQQRQAERQGLAAAGAGQRQQIPTRQRGGNGRVAAPGSGA